MQLSQIPTLVPLPFAANGTKNTIPEASQIGITAGAASLNDGFPPLTFTPLAAGGVPPSGADFNGVLNLLSANTQWANAGGFYEFNSSFASSIGGYPKSAILAKASGLGYWLNLEDNNSNDPDTGGAGWLSFDPWAIQSASYFTAKDTGTANAYAVTLSPAPSVLTPGMLVNILQIANTNTGAATLAVNGLSTLPILLAKGTALSGAELTAGYGAIVRLNNAGTAWELVFSAAGEFVPPASQKNATPQLSQLFIGNRKAVFTSNGTWPVPDFVSTIWVSGCGAGAGGAGSSSTSNYCGGGGGGSGGWALKQPISVTGGSTLTIALGGAGAGGTGGSSPANGADGGSTTLSDGSTTLFTLAGGAGGTTGTSVANGGAGGSPNGLKGGQGFSGINDALQGGVSIGGAGGMTPFGFSSPNVNGTGYGAGGGGGEGGGGGSSGSGGILIIEW